MEQQAQQTTELVLNIGLNLIFVFVGIVLALWYENLGAPRLIISKGATTDSVKPNNLRTRFLHLNVTNVPRKKIPFVLRQTAFSCHGTITFFTSDLKQLSNPMPIRWDGNPEPLNPEVVYDRVQYLPDFRLMRLSRYINIPPDELESLAIAIRISGEGDAYGWTSESYLHNWRHPDYKLPSGEFVARVSITTGDSVFRQDFRFNNPATFEAFDLVASL